MKGKRRFGHTRPAGAHALVALAGSALIVAFTPPSVTSSPVSGVKPPSVAEVPRVIRHGSRTSREVALTFDACSSRGRGKLDTAVAGVLIRTRTPATIFLGGKWARDVASALRPLCADSLIEFGNHAYMHPHLERFSDDSIRQELRKAQRVITRIVGKKPVLFRAPYGEVDARVAAVAESLGLTVIEYDLPSGDPDSLISEKSLVRYVVSMAKGGSIIVMHINARGWHTAEALPGIIAGLRRRGFTFVTVSRLVAESKTE
jgi:peptidoglycan/xylan/chitin deacetylase (PgdA/CDA1 family)